MLTFTGTAGDDGVAEASHDDQLTVRVGSTAQAGRQREKRAASQLHWGVTLALAFCLVLPQARADDRPTFPDFEPDTFELLSYQSSGYRFLVIPLDEEPLAGFEQPGFDDTGFTTGTAAFGGGRGGAGGGINCPLQNTVVTEWPVNTQLLVRRTISVPVGVTNLRMMISIDNDVLDVFFNGLSIAEFTAHDDCPILDEFRFDVPPELVQPGENLVAFRVLDRGVESFFDARILGELAPAQVVQQLDQFATVQQAPPVPISDVSVDSRIVTRGEASRTNIRYIVSATGESGEIGVDQTNTDELNVEFFLDGELMASGSTTPDEMTVLRSPGATERLANLDPGILSLGPVLTQQTVLDGLFRSFQAPAVSCETNCDFKAALASALGGLTASITKGGANSADITRRDGLSSFGAVFAADSYSAAAESRAKSRIADQRRQCLAACPCPAGQGRDPATAQCVVQPCPAGQTRDPTTAQCVFPPCPTGQTRDPATGQCSAPAPRPFSFLCPVDLFIPREGNFIYVGTCGGGLIQGIVTRIENRNTFPLGLLKPGRTNRDCNDPQARVVIRALGGVLEAAELQQLFGTARQQVPIGIAGCPLGVSAQNLPQRTNLGITVQR